MLDGRAATVHSLHNRQKTHVKTEHGIFGVIDDPADLIRMQTRIERVQDTTGAADAKVKFQMAVAVPGQGCHPVTELQLQAIKRIGHLARTRCHFLVGVAVDVAFNPARDDFTFAVVALGKLDERRDQ